MFFLPQKLQLGKKVRDIKGHSPFSENGVQGKKSPKIAPSFYACRAGAFLMPCNGKEAMPIAKNEQKEEGRMGVLSQRSQQNNLQRSVRQV